MQKEDIMQYSKEESKAIWNQNAEFWDCAMGDESNDSTDYILDIACGTGKKAPKTVC